jgi:hypothetical protein
MMAYRPRKNKIEINIEGDAFMPAVKEEIAFKDVGNCQVIPGSTGEYAPDRDEKDLWEEEKRVTLEETKNIDKWNK